MRGDGALSSPKHFHRNEISYPEYPLHAFGSKLICARDELRHVVPETASVASLPILIVLASHGPRE